jgi:hypothetical protein
LPYQTSDGSQDQRGFRIFDWYLDIVKHEIGRSIPIFLLRAGALPDDLRSSQGVPDLNRHSEANLAIAKLLLKDFQDADPSEAIPDEVLACCFWLLASEEQDGVSRQAWVSSNGKKLPVVQAFYRLAARRFVVKPDDLEQKPVPVMEKMINKTILASPTNTRTFVYIEPVIEQGDAKEIREKPLSHYVLLPLYAWGAGDWDLGAIQPLLKENHPTVGFSLTEARLAARVTVIGGEGAISSGAIEMLKKNGCIVERVLEDGTLVAP